MTKQQPILRTKRGGFTPLTIEGRIAFVHLTKGQRAIVDAADWLAVSWWRWTADVHEHTTYAYRRENGKTIRLHVFLMGGMADHQNHNGLDNRRENLRLASQTQNNWNIRGYGNTSKYRCVSKDRRPNRPKCWRLGMTRPNGTRFSREFHTEIEAAQAHDEYAKEWYGDFATLNFPQESSDAMEKLPSIGKVRTA